MKKCPKCGTTYTDETLRFCLADGATLTAVGDSEPTLVAKYRDNLRVDKPETQVSNVQASEPERSSGPWLKILAAILVLGFVGLVVVGFAGFLLYYSSGADEPAVVSKSPTPSPAATTASDEERQRLEDEVANLRKKLEEQQKAAPTNTRPFPSPEVPTDIDAGFAIAIVNSPGDGFLALRSEPSVEHGKLLEKIPHGTVIELNNCEKNQVTVAGRKGRWCQVNFADQSGYVFDAYLLY